MSRRKERREEKKAKRKWDSLCMTKRIVWVCVWSGIIWVSCSYVLAFLDKPEIAMSLSITAITELIGVVLVYCVKALLEKRDAFGHVGIHPNPDGSNEGD